MIQIFGSGNRFFRRREVVRERERESVCFRRKSMIRGERGKLGLDRLRVPQKVLRIIFRFDRLKSRIEGSPIEVLNLSSIETRID